MSNGKGDKKSPAGKGDKPRPTNYKVYKENYSEIKWGLYCINCGTKIDEKVLKSRPELYIKHEDGSVECKECNYN